MPSEMRGAGLEPALPFGKGILSPNGRSDRTTSYAVPSLVRLPFSLGDSREVYAPQLPRVSPNYRRGARAISRDEFRTAEGECGPRKDGFGGFRV